MTLYEVADAGTKRELAGYYRDGIERIVARGKTNPYGSWRSFSLVLK